MRSTARHLFPITLCMAMAILLNGCSLLARPSASPQLTVATPDPRHASAEQRWWRACFRMPFDKAQRPNWSMDALLAEQVAAPSLRRHAGKIRLWRFHRRATQDASGHQFSLLFYSDQTTASQLFGELQEHPLIDELVAAKQLTQLLAPCGSDKNQQAIEASSDPRWDPRLQKTWPHFIMGVSAHWLALIEEVGREIPLTATDSAALLERYRRIHQAIDEIWRKEGQHAHLHHLNALFGYQPLLMRY
jgi:hypothetical protein